MQQDQVQTNDNLNDHSFPKNHQEQNQTDGFGEPIPTNIVIKRGKLWWLGFERTS